MDEPPSPFFPYSDRSSTPSSTDGSPSPTDEPPSPFFPYSDRSSTPSSTDGSPSPPHEPPSPFFPYSDRPSTPSSTDGSPSPLHEPPSPLLKSRIPRKTIIIDRSDFTSVYDLDCPLRKGIFYYLHKGAICERNIYSSGKHEPRIIGLQHGSWGFIRFSFVPIKGNQMLLLGKYTKFGHSMKYRFLYLSIHDIRSDNRVGPALWSFESRVDGVFNMSDLELIKTTKSPLAITFRVWFRDHWKLFDTTQTDASDNFIPIESGRIDFDSKIKGRDHEYSLVKLSPDRRILLNMDVDEYRSNETIDIHYSDSGGTNFSFVTRISVPISKIPKHPADRLQDPRVVFSANGSKFAIAMNGGRVSVWDIQSKVPLKTFIAPQNDYDIDDLQFSSGKLGKEVLVFVERKSFSDPDIIRMIDATLFEMEETITLQRSKSYIRVGALFFDPSGGTLYAEQNGILYEWDLQNNKCGPEWWIGEE
ncbi:uncharacterized protein LACBIDRAFT_313184 [Laccaria bicolor S238N-H82]|uniref:Predicted protein n=1 Tax=Laccaria bicolor (strain S238N-H82 / ATCC MYA-4686) TaxID=486041 RepID=B0DXQ9_LACBS|nr:uncharacterized protein LACBIDRAFT_313184 [Laccaria bicolor S238N-H82]EDR00725.1 predicted protein [Laccaria bicolor S238N-H82]|eukprot:XP_001888734.1 predicted protein [Laccaria bicolor S238N-H82]